MLACVPERALRELLGARPDWWRLIATGILEYGDLAISAYVDSLIPDNDRRCACTLLRIAGLKHPRRSGPERTEVLVIQDGLAPMVNLSRRSRIWAVPTSAHALQHRSRHPESQVTGLHMEVLRRFKWI